MHIDTAFKSPDNSDEHKGVIDANSRAVVIRHALELCFFKECTLNGKEFKVWPKLRAALKDRYINCLLQASRSQSLADSIIDSLLSAIDADMDTALAHQVSFLFEEHGATLQAFLLDNPQGMAIGSHKTIASSTGVMWPQILHTTETTGIEGLIELMFKFVTHALDLVFHRMCVLAGKLIATSSGTDLFDATHGVSLMQQSWHM